MGANGSPSPVVLQSGEGSALWHLGALLDFKARVADTGGQFWALEGLADANLAVPLHAHAHEDEVWFVTAGEIAFTVGEETFAGGPGTFAYIPRTVPHTFQVVTGQARWFGFGLGGHLDDWFFETGVPAGERTLPPPPPGPPSEDDIAAIVASLEAYGTTTLGPPPGA